MLECTEFILYTLGTLVMGSVIVCDVKGAFFIV